MKIRWIFLIIMTAAFLSGCTMAPKYSRPKPPVPADLPGGEPYLDVQSAMEALPLATLRWQDLLPDKKLQKVVEIALANNRDLRLAVLNVERARAYYGIQQAELFPAVDLTAGGSKYLTPADISPYKKNTYTEQYSVDLGIASWEVDLFGRIRSLKEQALQEYLSTEQARRGARTSLISEVALVYLTLAADLENLKLAQATLEVQRSVYGVIWQQYDQGIIGEPDLRRSQTQVDTASRDIARYEQLVEQDRNALNLLAGFAVPEDLLPAGLVSISPFKDILSDLSSNVLLRRPDILAAEHRLKASNAFIGAARAAFFPRISLTTALGSSSNELAGLFGSGAKAWSFAAQTAMPIFDMRVGAAYKVSKAERDIAVAQYEKAIQTAFKEVADVLAMRGNIDQQVDAQDSIVDSAQKVYDLSRQRYTQGIDSYLSVLDAQRSLYLAQKELTYLRLAKQGNLVKLYAVLGGDGEWKK